MCGDKMGKKDQQIVFTGFRKSDPDGRLLNTDKNRERTGCMPKVTLEQGIEECVKELNK